MTKVKVFFSILPAFLLMQVFSQEVAVRDFKSYFDAFGVNGCFVLYDEATDNFISYNPARCDSGYIPASTFKIPHAIIALEEGIVKDTSQIIKWNGHVWPNANWNQDQTLKTSIKYSCVWVYTGFAQQIGIKRYQKYVRDFNYGNKDLTGQPTRFWLAGLFRISANQQIDFLRKFYHHDLPVAERSVNLVKDCIVLEQTDQYKFSGKTGGGMLTDTDYIMWLVGYIERDGKVYYYAMNFKSDDFNGTSQARYEITKGILRELKLME